jgi:diguanylate cyclase (GGDEF)-like protein/PAS domain S-box-containing protein
MKWHKHPVALPSIGIAAAAVLLGFTLTLRFVVSRLLSGNPAQAIAMADLGDAGAVILALALIALIAAKARVDRRYQFDRDLLNTFLDHIPDSVFFKDRSSRFIRVSRAMATHFGLSGPAQLLHKTDFDFFSAEHANAAFADEQKILSSGDPVIGIEEKETFPDGREGWVLTTKVPLRNRFGTIIGTMGISRDITDRKQAELRIRHMALHDALTGLPNRTLLQDRLGHAISLAIRHHQRIGVLMLDLDRFKTINDSLGHYIGDRLLVEVARRLKASLRESDVLARFGGDEFVIVLPLIAGRADIEHVAEKVQSTLLQLFKIEGHDMQIGCSIGICEYPGDGENAEALLQNADAAMYQAKKAGRGTWAFFTPQLTEATLRRQKLETDLRQACARGQFVLYYQPLVCTNSGEITGVEALLRWMHPEQGLIPPNLFIPQLEELSIMVEVGRWVLETACRQNVAWQMQGLHPVRMAVNISAQQFYRGNLVRTVSEVLRQTGMDPKWLELELTESLTIDDSEATVQIMRDLKSLGVSISLDDFGTGWSSLAYLRRFQFDRIKIDRSFMRDLVDQPAADTVVRSILNLGRSLGLACTAEGVETRQQLDYLQKQMCPEMQGFLCSPALPPAECTMLLEGGGFGFSTGASNHVESLPAPPPSANRETFVLPAHHA